MKNDLEILSKYESWFYTAVNSDYIRALWKDDFDVLVPIYEKWTNTKSDVTMNCSKCKLSFIKKLGKLYYKNKEEYANKSNSESREKEEPHKCRRKGDTGHKGVRDSKTIGKGRKPKNT